MVFDGAPFDRILVVDAETAWCSKSGYTLSKLTTEEYLRDPRFKTWGFCFKWFDKPGKAQWVRGIDLPSFLSAIDWSRTAVLAHNSMFDLGILMWHYGIKPVFIFDSLSIARATRGVEVGNSLAKLADAFGLPAKGTAVHSTDGMLDELPPRIEAELADYCAHDVYLCEEIFKRLGGVTFPVKELRLIDMTLRMFLQPFLELDAPLLVEAIKDEKEKREGLLQRLGIDEKKLASNPQFAQALRAVGIEPPMKTSKTTGKPALALAKSDAMFQAMLNGDREDVALLCEARLSVKSTLERTRAQRFLDISTRGRLPVPLNYGATQTHRFAAAKGAGLNMQNLKRGSFLRRAILAPTGYRLVVGDLAQIEPRILAWLADYFDFLDLFRSGQDVYSAFGTQMFNTLVSKTGTPELRQSAKSAALGCGFGLSWPNFSGQLLTGFLGAPPIRYDKDFAKKLGVSAEDTQRFLRWEENIKKMEAIPHLCTNEELLVHCLAAKAIIDRYRATAHQVVEFWGVCGRLLESCIYGGDEYVYKCLTFRKEEIVLPSGMSMRYPDIKKTLDAKGRPQYTYGNGVRIYSSKVAENVTQAIARIVMTDGMLRIGKRYPVLASVHDEVVAGVPEDEVKEAEGWVLEQMTKVPSWMPGIPLAAEVGSGVRYGECKT